MNESMFFSTDVEIMEGIGARLRGLRKAQDLTLEQVAERTELNPSTVVRAEQGKNPTLQTLTRLLRCYGALGGLQALVPEPPVSPLAAARARKGDSGG